MEEGMRNRLKALVAVAFGVAALAAPLISSAQENSTEKSTAKHHHYKVTQMGTFGGANSGIDVTGNPPKFPFNKVITQSGEVLGTADTTIPDPYCFDSCTVNYAFLWTNGVQTNLGVLPQSSPTGPQTPCFDCAWSVFTFWIADNGLVAGQSLDNTIDPYTGLPAGLAVIWKDGKIFNLGTLGGNQSGAGAVNRRGEVVGGALTPTPDPFPGRTPYLNYFYLGNGTESHAFLWRNGNMKDLGTLGGPDSAAFLVNEEGQVAGTSDVDFNVNPVTGGPTVHPFLWQHGDMIDLVASAPEGMFGGTYGIAAWLNDKGQVLGTMNLPGDTTWRSFVWDKGVVTPLGTLGGITTTAQFLNNAGHASGKSDVTAICTACAPDNQKQLHHPFLWKDGTMIDLGLLYDDTAGSAYSLNAKDQVVGVTVPCTTVNADDSCDGPLYHAFLWENGSMVDVQTLLVPGSGITLSGCAGCELGGYNINDRGEIASQGLLSNGDSRAVLLIPCDENHPDVEGCDYSLVDASNNAQPKLAQTVHAGSSLANTSNLSPSQPSADQPLTKTDRRRKPGISWPD
jgi:probable HAF family extracellular repeat protein